MSSPYEDLTETEWLAKTEELVSHHPLDKELARKHQKFLQWKECKQLEICRIIEAEIQRY